MRYVMKVKRTIVEEKYVVVEAPDDALAHDAATASDQRFIKLKASYEPGELRFIVDQKPESTQTGPARSEIVACYEEGD